MKQFKLLLVSATLAMSSVVSAASINMGIILGFTGPIESLTPDMAKGAEIAWEEASASGALMGGMNIKVFRADSTCTDAGVATSGAERLVTSNKVLAIMGADCSGVTGAVVNNVAVPNGVVMVSPSATSPALSDIKDKGYFFRTAPSDARQGEVMAEIIVNKGVKEIAVTYTNNDYGKGLQESFASAFKKLGGEIVATVPHEDGKADYSAEVATLSASGAKWLAVFGYLDKGGKGIIQASLDLDAFSHFALGDGMIGDSLTDNFGNDINGTIGTVPGSESDSVQTFKDMAAKAGVKGNGPYQAESYDAAALIALSLQASGKLNRQGIRDNMNRVANAPGIKIYPGELAMALKILARGGEVNYEGATGVKFNDVGGVFGSYKELVVKSGKFETVKVW